MPILVIFVDDVLFVSSTDVFRAKLSAYCFLQRTQIMLNMGLFGVL